MDGLKRVASRKVPPEMRAALPSLADVQRVARGMSKEDIAASARQTLSQMDDEKVAEFGRLLQRQMAKQGKTLPPGVTQGNVNEIAGMLAGMIKGETNPELRQALQNPAVQESVKGMAMARLATGKFGLLAMLLRDPRAAGVIMPVVRGLLRK